MFVGDEMHGLPVQIRRGGIMTTPVQSYSAPEDDYTSLWIRGPDQWGISVSGQEVGRHFCCCSCYFGRGHRRDHLPIPTSYKQAHYSSQLNTHYLIRYRLVRRSFLLRCIRSAAKPPNAW